MTGFVHYSRREELGKQLAEVREKLKEVQEHCDYHGTCHADAAMMREYRRAIDEMTGELRRIR